MASGCATTPRGTLAESRIFQIEGSSYLPLSAVAKLNDMRFTWDLRREKAVLERQTLRLRLRVGSAVVVVNGETEMLDRPVLLHHGNVVVPVSFSKFLSKYFAPEVMLHPPRPPRIQTVVIDAGHGGHDTGAVGRMGLKEKQVNLDIARRLKTELEAQELHVVMTRKDDHFVSLYQRTYIANREEGDFFVSIHCNASRNRDVDGFEIYYAAPFLEETSYATTAEASPLRNSTSNGASPADAYYERSMELAGHITSAMEHRLPLLNRGAKSARFFVLRGVSMPAILVEVGYISNPAQEASLEEKSYRQDIAEAIAEGVFAYKQDFERRESLESADANEEPANRDF